MDITADELINMFDQSLEKIENKDGLSLFLDILSRNPELEFLDAVNLFTQYPSGRMLNTYRCWDRDYGRHVKRWEKGIRSIEYTEEELTDDDGNVYDIRPVPKVIYKYDVSQTQGKAVRRFAKEYAICNKKCQAQFRILLCDVINEVQKELGLAVNSFSGSCARYVLLKFFGMPDPEFERGIERYGYQNREAVSYFLGELFGILDKVCYRLQHGYAQTVSVFLNMEPDPEVEVEKPVEKEMPDKTPLAAPAPEIAPDVPAAIQSPKTIPHKKAPGGQRKERQKKENIVLPPPKNSLLRRLRLKVKEAKIYNAENKM